MILSKKAQKIQPSATLAITAKAKELKAAGVDVISFAAGEPDFPTPAYIRNAAKDFIDNGRIVYTAASGTEELKAAIVKNFEEEYGLSYTTKEVIVSNGAKQCIRNAFEALLDEGDEVIVPSPYWVSYPQLAEMSGGVPVYIHTDETTDFKITAEQLENAITDRTRVLVLNSPCNPTGAAYTKPELEKLAAVLEKHPNVTIMADEIYAKLLFDKQTFTSIASLSPAMKKQTLVINGVSKAYAMTGWRIGYAAGDAALIKAMGSIQSHATSNPNTVAQYAATVALTEKSDDLPKMQAAFEARRDRIVELLNQVKDVTCAKPGGAFYVMPNCTKLYDKVVDGKKIGGSTNLCKILLEKANIACVPGIEFGNDDYIRLSYATDMASIEEGVRRFAAFAETL